MKFENKNILIISPEAWGDIFVSKHHYAVTLTENGNNVFFLNPPASKYNVSPSKFQNVTVLDYPRFPKGLRFYPTYIQKFIFKQRFTILEKLAQCSFDIIWSFDTSVFFNFSFLTQKVLKILHLVDLNQDFQLKSAAISADICFCTTDLIRAKLVKYNINSYKINHGVVLRDLQYASTITLPGANMVKALYVGNLSMRFIDWEKLLGLAKKFTKIDFVFLGPDGNSNLSEFSTYEEAKTKLKELENTYMLPAVPAPHIMSYLLSADILLVSYKEKHYDDQASPHKILEYLASGKPIVASWTAEYANTDLLFMAKSVNEYIDAFNWVMNNLEEVSNASAVTARRNFAENNTYKKQLERIEALIEKACY